MAPECVFNESHGVFYTGTGHVGRSVRRFSAGVFTAAARRPSNTRLHIFMAL